MKARNLFVSFKIQKYSNLRTSSNNLIFVSNLMSLKFWIWTIIFSPVAQCMMYIYEVTYRLLLPPCFPSVFYSLWQQMGNSLVPWDWFGWGICPSSCPLTWMNLAWWRQILTHNSQLPCRKRHLVTEISPVQLYPKSVEKTWYEHFKTFHDSPLKSVWYNEIMNRQKFNCW